jgi:hypothetical protein
VNTTVTASGQSLSDVGAVVAADKGVDTDMFFLSFEQIGARSHAHVEPVVPVAAQAFPAVLPSRKGVKNFAQVNAAMSAITGVPVANATVNKLYNTIQQALPPTNDITAFLGSHQSAIAQLADQYCTIAVTSPTAGTVFNGVALPATAAGFGTQANQDLVINALIARAIGTNVNPNEATVVTTELRKMMGTLSAKSSSAAAIAQAACTATLGSAVVSLQ